jgi:hypothetical protein
METPCEIDEEFASVRLVTAKKALGGAGKDLLLLTYSGAMPPRSFAALCAEFLFPGQDGEYRSALLADPAAWWKDWKELIGNENVDLRVYDVLGEMCVVRYLARIGAGHVSWHGPEGSVYDIHTDTDLYEVKSTVVKGDKRVVIHNAFQLDAGSAPLHLMHCVFEPSTAGESVNDLIEDLRALGAIDIQQAESFLKTMGMSKGKSVRNRKYLLLSIEQFDVDSRFPVISPLPVGVIDLEYTVELGAFAGTKVV